MTEQRQKTLIISLLILNIFLAGVITGGALIFLQKKPNNDLPLGGDGLKPAEKATLIKVLLQIRRDCQPILVDEDQAKAEAAALLERPVLDKAALLEALNRVRNDDLLLQTLIDQRSVEFASALQPQDRILLAHAFERSGKNKD